MAIVDRIKVSIEGYGIWAGFEATISPEENPIDEWIKLKELVQLAMNQSDSMKGVEVVQVQKEPKEAAIDSHIAAINSYSDGNKLIRNFENLIRNSNDQRLNDAFYNKLNSLKDKP